jgi:hypothetical protein
MNIIDLRKNLRASANHQRINNDRRKNPHPFGSSEWLDYIHRHNLQKPTHDRRKELRRASDRRRQAELTQYERPYTRILLTPAEKKLLADMYLMDLEQS